MDNQAAFLSEAVAGTGVALTYSTEWADGRLDRPTWNANALGLGGWSLDVLERYDAANSVLLSGDGSWRIVTPVDLPGGEHAIPTFDGFRYCVFDSSWRHVRTVDSVSGTTLLTFSYDDTGRLATVRGAIDASAVELTVERTSDGFPDGLVGLEGTRTGIAIGTDGQLGAVFRPDGSALLINTAPFGLISPWSESGRGTTKFEYDTAGRLASATDPDGVTRQYAFDNSGGAVTVTTSWTTRRGCPAAGSWSGSARMSRSNGPTARSS